MAKSRSPRDDGSVVCAGYSTATRVALFGILFGFLLSSNRAFGQARWGTNFQAARSASLQAKKPILIDFMASWCGPCRKMDEETFPDSRVQALFKNVILVRLDVDANPPQAKQFEVTSIPRVILLQPGGAGAPMMDLLGYREPDDFSQELGEALGINVAAGRGKPDPHGMTGGGTAGGSAGNPALAQVRQALESNRFAALRSSDPKKAGDGLNRMVELLGVTKEADFPPIAALIGRAGGDAVPALIRGLSNSMLAVRAGAFRALQESLRNSGPLPPFDAWAPTSARKQQAQRWAQWWANRRPR